MRINLEDITLNEISHSRRRNTASFYLYEVSREAQSRIVVARDYGKGKMGSYCLMSIELQSFKMKKNSRDVNTYKYQYT